MLVADINPGSTTDSYGDVNPNSSSPRNLTLFNGLLFFSANDGADGRELWESNGTAAGTKMVLDINPGRGSSNPASLTVVGNDLFFEANDGTHGIELWKSDGTAKGTVLVKDINPGAGGSAPSYAGSLINVNGSLLFTANDGSHGIELWRSDGTADGTAMVKDINPGAAGSVSNSVSTSFAVAGGQLFFAADDGTHGRELWQSDGTATGTRVVMDINPGGSDAFSAYGQVITSVNGSLYFAADDGIHGVEPWVISASQLGSPLAGIRVKSIVNPGPPSSPKIAATVPSLVTQPLAPQSVAQALVVTSPVGTLTVSPPRTVRAQARSAAPAGPLGSFIGRIGSRLVPAQLQSEAPIDSFPRDRSLLDRAVHQG